MESSLSLFDHTCEILLKFMSISRILFRSPIEDDVLLGEGHDVEVDRLKLEEEYVIRVNSGEFVDGSSKMSEGVHEILIQLDQFLQIDESLLHEEKDGDFLLHRDFHQFEGFGQLILIMKHFKETIIEAA